MNPTRDDIALYVSGNFDGDAAALEAAVAADPALARILAEEAELELMLRDAAASATFCPACGELVRAERCNSCGAALQPGGYTVERVLVSNAHGRMYVAHDADGRQVALKELAFVHAPSPAAVAAFERETKFLRALSHPAIPRFVAAFEEGQGVHTRYYLAQELVEGTSLDKLDDKWYTEAEIVDIAKQVLAIIHYLQSLSPMVIHRDIKPANLIVRTDRSIALVDFGAAHAHGTTAGVTTIGTFGYMPIEQLAGIVDGTTDLYALGASLLHLLTRQEPWKLAQSKTTVNVSAPLRAFLDKLTAADPKDRFQSAKAALAGLEGRDQLVSKKPGGTSRARRIVLGALAATTVAAAGAGIYEYGRATSSSNEPGPSSRMASLKMSIPSDRQATLWVDGMQIATVTNGMEVALAAGKHAIKLVANDTGASCEAEITLVAGKSTTAECGLGAVVPRTPPEARVDVTTNITASFKGTPLESALHTFAEACGLNIVLPDFIGARITTELADVPCDEALEVLLESHGLWYDYQPSAKLLRVAPRKELDAEREATITRKRNDSALPPGAIVDDPLPTKASTLDLDVKGAPLRDVLRLISTSSGVQFMLPDSIDGKVTVRLKGVPWQQALEVVLASHGLWYRYRSEGKLVRVAPRKELDAEVEAAIARSQVK